VDIRDSSLSAQKREAARVKLDETEGISSEQVDSLTPIETDGEHSNGNGALAASADAYQSSPPQDSIDTPSVLLDSEESLPAWFISW